MPDLNIKIDKWQNKTDPDLSTFGRLKTQISSTQQVKFFKKNNKFTFYKITYSQKLDSLQIGNRNPKNIVYMYKPTEKLEDKFKIFKLKENGKDAK